MTRRAFALGVSGLSLAAAAGLLVAGPLNPPAGIVVPTYKTLNEVEPRIAINATNTPGDADSMFKITAPGAYYLTAQVAALPGKMGIKIATDGVTIDLNGYRVGGFPGSSSGISTAGADRSNITIKNGSVGPVGGAGITLGVGSDVVRACRIEDVTITDCGGTGVSVGADAVLRNLVAMRNGMDGITAGRGCTLTGCVASGNAQDGIGVGEGSTVTGCTASGNANTGFVGFATTFHGCSATDNEHDGFLVTVGSMARQCTASRNSESGIVVSGGSLVESCTVFGNDLYGIFMFTQCTARNNMCNANGSNGSGANLWVGSPQCVVEGNQCIDGNIGIRVQTARSLLRGNSCSGNATNWSVVAGNVCYVVNATSGPAFSGNSGGSPLGTTDPNANFTY